MAQQFKEVFESVIKIEKSIAATYDLIKKYFFLEMEFVLKKVNYASFINGLLRRKILSIPEKCNELSDEPDLFIDFIDDLNQLEFLRKEEELDENETSMLKQTYKENIKPFLICHQLWQKFGNEFNFLDLVTMKFAIIFETNKTKSFIKEIKKLELLSAKVTVISKTFI